MDYTETTTILNTSTENSATEEGLTEEPVWWTEAHTEELSSYLWRYSAPLIFFLGCFGNVTTLIVLRWRRSATDTATTYFVQLVAAADLCFLIAGMLPQWMMMRHVADPMEDSVIGCKIYKFFMYSAGDVAVWYMAAFTVERFVAVYYPLKRSEVCRISRIKLTALLLVGLAIVKNVHTFWTRGAQWKLVDANHTEPSFPVDNTSTPYSDYTVSQSRFYVSEQGDRYELVSNCGYTTEEFEYFHLHIRVWMVFVLANLVPLLILIFCNTLVVWKLVHLRRTKASQVSSSADSAAQQITIMCLVISVSFLVFIMPSMILLVGKPHFKTTDTASAKYSIAQAVNNQLLYINHSINFYLYFITCPSFRKQTVALFLCKKPPEKAKSHNSGAAPVHLTAYRSSSAAQGITDMQSRSLLSPGSGASTPV